jgi:hypothetical protein
MHFLSEQHLATAKRIRVNAIRRTGVNRERLIKMSNSFVICVRLSAKDRGGIAPVDFDWSSLRPNWNLIEEQLERLAPSDIAGPPLVPNHEFPI